MFVKGSRENERDKVTQVVAELRIVSCGVIFDMYILDLQ